MSNDKEIKYLLINNKLRIAITNNCNLSCSYCHNEGQPHCDQIRYLSLDYIKKLARWFQINNVYVERVSITGGEPLLHPDLLEIIDEMRKVSNNLHLNTNGLLLTRELVDKFNDRKVVLRVGIDSIDAGQTKPNLYKTSAYNEDILKIIKYATSNNAHVIFSTVFSKFNYKSLDNLICWAMDNGVKCVKIIKLNDFDSRSLNNRLDIDDVFKTNQPETNHFYEFRNKYIERAWHFDEYHLLGKSNVFLRDRSEAEFKIVFCEDLCISGACANIYTAIDSEGNFMVCPKYNITISVDFQDDFTAVSKIIANDKNKKCDSSKNRFDIRETNKNTVE